MTLGPGVGQPGVVAVKFDKQQPVVLPVFALFVSCGSVCSRLSACACSSPPVRVVVLPCSSPVTVLVRLALGFRVSLACSKLQDAAARCEPAK